MNVKKRIVSVLLSTAMVTPTTLNSFAHEPINTVNDNKILESNAPSKVIKLYNQDTNESSDKLKAYPVDKLNGFSVVKGPSITSKPYNTSAQMSAAREALLYGAGSLLNGIVGASITATTIANKLLGLDYFDQIGGVYTKSYYVRKILHPEQADLNVPVPYQYAYVTFIYRSSVMSDSTLHKIVWQYDGGPRLASN